MAGAIMALAITTSITAMQQAFLSLDSARNVTIAGQILQTELERMRLKDWSTVDAYPTATTTLTIDSSFTDNPAIGNRFTLTRTVSAVRSGLKEITFTVGWQSYNGRAQSRSFVTYYGQNGLYDYFYNSS